MATLFTVAVVNGVPTGGSGDVSTMDTYLLRVGEVQASPTANTMLGRLKDITDKLTAIDANTNGVEGLLGGTLTVGGTITASLAAAQTLSTVTTVGAVTSITNALPTGSNAIGKLAANSGVTIGAVEIAGSQTIGLAAGSAAIGKLAANSSGILIGQVEIAASQSITANVATAGTALTSAARGSERALSVQIVDGSGTQITSFGGAGGTASNFGSAFPTPGTAVGFSDGTNMVAGKVGDVNNVAAATGYQDVLGIGRYNATQPTLTDTRFNALQVSSRGALIVNQGVDTFTVVSKMQDGGGTNLTAATRGSERALSVQIVDGSGTQVTSFGGAGGTSSNFGSAFPSAGTAIGFTDGTNLVAAKVGAVSNVASVANALQSITAARYDATQPTLTDTRYNALQVSSRGALFVNQGAETFTVTIGAALPAGTAAIGKLAANTGVTIGAVEIAASQSIKATNADGAGNNLTSASRGSERALSVQIVDASGTQITTFGGAGGTSSSFGSAFPAAGTAAGFSDGTNLVAAKVGTIANLAAATNMLNVLPAGRYDATQPTLTDTRFNALQLTSRGAVVVNQGAETFTVTVGAALPTGSNAIGKLAANSSGVLIGQVEIAATQTIGIAAGTAGIGKLTANSSGVLIGQVEIASAQTLATVTTVTNSPQAANFAAATTQTVTAGGTAQALFGSAVVNGFEIWNLDVNTSLWISLQGTAVAATEGSFEVEPSGYYCTPPGMRPNNAGSIKSTLTGHKFTANRW